jgi:hypothetical protein
MISDAADADHPLGRLTGRHLVHCERCRRFHESCRQLGARLRSEAADPGRASGPFARQVLAGLADTRRASQGPSVETRIAAAACVAVAALAGLLLLARTPRPPERPIPPVGIPRLAGMGLRGAWSHVLERPLTTEVQKLTEDTESSVRFLVACLDVSPLNNRAAPPGEPFTPPPTP